MGRVETGESKEVRPIRYITPDTFLLSPSLSLLELLPGCREWRQGGIQLNSSSDALPSLSPELSLTPPPEAGKLYESVRNQAEKDRQTPRSRERQWAGNLNWIIMMSSSQGGEQCDDSKSRHTRQVLTLTFSPAPSINGEAFVYFRQLPLMDYVCNHSQTHHTKIHQTWNNLRGKLVVCSFIVGMMNEIVVRWLDVWHLSVGFKLQAQAPFWLATAGVTERVIAGLRLHCLHFRREPFPWTCLWGFCACCWCWPSRGLRQLCD